MEKKMQVTVSNLHIISGKVRLGNDFHVKVAQVAGEALGIDPECIGVKFMGEMSKRGSLFYQAPVFSVQCSSASNNHNCDPARKVEKLIIALVDDLCQGSEGRDFATARQKQVIAKAAELLSVVTTGFLTGRTPHLS